jgi:hypothetical protein
MANVTLENIIQNLSSRSQVKEFFQQYGTTNLIIIEFYFPDFSCFNSEFVFQVFHGTKFVILFLNILNI